MLVSMKSVAINIGTTTEHPGGPGPIYADGSFAFLPIPETDAFVTEPTYAQLGLAGLRPPHLSDRVVHFDPEFPEFRFGQRYTFGHREPPCTTAISRLERGDILFFYAVLHYADDEQPRHDWINPEWGVYLIGHFTLDSDPITGVDYNNFSPDERAALSNNAHARRKEFDAEILVVGSTDRSSLYEEAIPLSGDAGEQPNTLITVHSDDSGTGPWYRRPIPFDDTATRWILDRERRTAYEAIHG